jgi:hypothetical protein
MAMIALAEFEILCESFSMKKVRKAKMTWETLLKIEEKHPFSAGNLTRSFASSSSKAERRSSGQKKTSGCHGFVPA